MILRVKDWPLEGSAKRIWMREVGDVGEPTAPNLLKNRGVYVARPLAFGATRK
jgi:hypothetical protein